MSSVPKANLGPSPENLFGEQLNASLDLYSHYAAGGQTPVIRIERYSGEYVKDFFIGNIKTTLTAVDESRKGPTLGYFNVEITSRSPLTNQRRDVVKANVVTDRAYERDDPSLYRGYAAATPAMIIKLFAQEAQAAPDLLTVLDAYRSEKYRDMLIETENVRPVTNGGSFLAKTIAHRLLDYPEIESELSEGFAERKSDPLVVELLPIIDREIMKKLASRDKDTNRYNFEPGSPQFKTAADFLRPFIVENLLVVDVRDTSTTLTNPYTATEFPIAELLQETLIQSAAIGTESNVAITARYAKQYMRTVLDKYLSDPGRDPQNVMKVLRAIFPSTARPDTLFLPALIDIANFVNRRQRRNKPQNVPELDPSQRGAIGRAFFAALAVTSAAPNREQYEQQRIADRLYAEIVSLLFDQISLKTARTMLAQAAGSQAVK